MVANDHRGASPARVFISYARESDEHFRAVGLLAELLRDSGLDVRLDQAEDDHRLDLMLWMTEEVGRADYILVVASRSYRERAGGLTAVTDGRGVQFEARLIRDRLHANQPEGLRTIVPVVLPGQRADDVPDWLTPTSTTVYTVRELTPDGVGQLLRVLASERRPVTFLHLSDLRLGGSADAERDPDVEFGRLRDDLERLRADHDLRPDAVIVSGDLVESGKPSEFARCLKFLTRLADHLELPRQRFVIVPGERDVNREACAAHFAAEEARERTPEPPYWPKWEGFAALLERFHEGDPAARFTPDAPWALREVGDLRVVVAAINSTVRVSHLADQSCGAIGEEQLTWFEDRLRAYDPERWLRVGVVHHDPGGAGATADERLSDAVELDRRLAPRLDLLLHGHPAEDRAPRPTGGALRLGAGSAGHGSGRYEVVRVGLASATVLARRLADTGWVGDERLTGGRDWTLTLPLPAPTREVPTARGHEADDFLRQVLEVTRLRLPGATVTEVTSPVNGVRYLRVLVASHSMVRTRPVGACAQGVSRADVDRFEEVHQRYRQADPHVVSELVYGGPEAPEELVEEAEKRGIRLVSFLEHQGVLDLRRYVRRQTRRLDADVHYPQRLYVAQRYALVEGADRSPRADLLDAIVQWFRSPQGRFVLVLGDQGSGKSFLTRELFRRIDRELPMVPVLIQLGALQKATSLDVLIAQHLSDAEEKTIDLDAFRYMLSEGRIALLLDAYDELANRVTYERAADHLRMLLDACKGRAKVVLTSRTQHFRSHAQVTTAIGDQISALPGRRLVQLLPLGEDEIRAILTRLLGDEDEMRRRFDLIGDVEDLAGLSQNPRMLSFIAELGAEPLVEIRERRGKISAAQLYRLLIEKWLAGERDRAEPAGSPPTLTVEQRWAAVSQLAMDLWPRSEATLGLREMTAAVAAVVEALQVEGMGADQTTHVVGLGTLLVRDEDGQFGFVHRSVMEWLVAARAAEAIAGGDNPEWLRQQKMSRLMADFLWDLAGPEVAAAWARREGSRPSTDAGVANALRVLRSLGQELGSAATLAGRTLRGADLSRQDLRGTDLRGADLADSVMVQAQLQGAVLAGASLRGARLDGADLTGADLSEADLTGARLLGAGLRGTTLRDTRLRWTALIGADLDPGAAAVAPAELQFARPDTQTSAVAIDPGGEVLVTSGEDGTVRLWGAQSGRLLRTLEHGTSPVRDVVVCPTGRWLASAGDEGTVCLWDADSGALVRTLEGHSGPVACLAISPDGHWLASAGDDRAIRLWELATGRLVHVLEGSRAPVRGIAISPDGRLLAAAGYDPTVRVWEVEGDAPPRTLEAHAGSVWRVAFSPEGGWLVTAGDGGMVLVWDAESGAHLRSLEGSEGSVRGVAVSPDGRWLATAGDDRRVRLWDAATGQLLRVLHGHRATVRSVAISPDGRWLATAGDGRSLRMWEADTGRQMRTLEGGTRPVAGVAISSDGRWLASAGHDRGVRLWDAASGRVRRRLEGHTGHVLSVAISPDGRWLVSAGDDRSVRLWDAATGELLHRLEGHTGRALCVACSPDGRWLASAGEDGIVWMWEAASGRLLRSEHHGAPVRAVACTPNARWRWVVSAGDDGMLRRWTPESGGLPFRRGVQWQALEGRIGPLTSVATSQDGRWLAAGGFLRVRLWNLASGLMLRTLTGHDGTVRCVAFSPNGQWLASGGDDRTVQLWDVTTGDLLMVLSGHMAPVRSVAVSPDGRWLASASDDNTLRLWDADTGGALATLLPLGDGWACLLPGGAYKLHGPPAGEFWYAAGLHRFEPGELDEYVDGLRLVDDEVGILPQPNGGREGAPERLQSS
jgi:WD40 repeat protein/3',5'-cyclic AMP phosphodiesterase CpdA